MNIAVQVSFVDGGFQFTSPGKKAKRKNGAEIVEQDHIPNAWMAAGDKGLMIFICERI